MRKLTLTLLTLFTYIVTTAQNKKDNASIKKMCGCFEVTFNFAETFSYSKDSLYKPSKNKVATAIEWATLIEDEKNKISIQHILQAGKPGSKPHIVKHWRQDWKYQNENFYMFNGDNQWKFESKPTTEVEGQWTQKVYQVDDSPRYEGSGTWVYVDGKTYWESTTDAPLPRREYTKRSDYNVTERGSRHEITDYGWVHDQDNKKIVREAGKEDVLLAQEKGYNTYVRIDDAKCKAAKDWWETNFDKWQLVRNKWQEVFARNQNLNLHAKVDNKQLFKSLFKDDFNKKKDINKLIESFIIK